MVKVYNLKRVGKGGADLSLPVPGESAIITLVGRLIFKEISVIFSL